ncbi:MAG TPA: radical SAM protein [Candidatus Methylomirabilis sp.]|nr:radical SAM protein [Candidatus Methylomirabilis sp.]
MNQARSELSLDASRRLLVKEGLVYGPIASRRLGRSLGVNLLGFDAKLCSFNCRYCQCGWTKCPTMTLGRRIDDLPSAEQVVGALEQKLRQLLHDRITVDVITFSGNGEPTLHPQLGRIVEGAASLRDHYSPVSKLAILSNSSTVHKPEVRAALERVDLKIMKLDAGSERLLRRINLPARGCDFNRMLQGLAELEGVILQSMFVSGAVDNTNPPAVREWLKRIVEIHPEWVQVYSLDRTPPDPRIRQVPRTILESIAYYARWRTGVPVDVC